MLVYRSIMHADPAQITIDIDDQSLHHVYIRILHFMVPYLQQLPWGSWPATSAVQNGSCSPLPPLSFLSFLSSPSTCPCHESLPFLFLSCAVLLLVLVSQPEPHSFLSLQILIFAVLHVPSFCLSPMSQYSSPRKSPCGWPLFRAQTITCIGS